MKYKVDYYKLFLVSLNRIVLERVAGIEPAPWGRKHRILPLNYTRVN